VGRETRNFGHFEKRHKKIFLWKSVFLLLSLSLSRERKKEKEEI
jgi:hypothetical protein